MKKTLRSFQYKSGREDLNLRPLAPHASALAGLRHAPICVRNYTLHVYFAQPFRRMVMGEVSREALGDRSDAE